jgi:hypothetical protein
MKLSIQIVTLALPILLASCAAYGPYHPNTSAEPLNSVRGPADGRYKLAFVEFGDQGSALDPSQRAAALGVIHEAKRPLLFVYIHGWHNGANSADVCRFEHFIDTVSRFPDIPGVEQDYLGLLPASEFLKLVENESAEIRSAIFYDNVRHWQEWNPVNTEMRTTLSDAGSKVLFPLLNNGITVVARRVNATANRFLVEDYQIVNGCQTSFVLHECRDLLNEQVNGACAVNSNTG